MNTENKDLKPRTKEFALRIIKLYCALPKTTVAQVLGKQVLRSGTSVGAVSLNNATSGSVTISPPTGALGSAVATVPANTGTIAESNLAQTWSAAQSFTSLKFANLADSSTAPTISSGCGGGSPSISAPNGTDAFVVTIGTASGSTCVVAMPTATTGWICSANDITTHTTANFQVLQTASSASSVTVTDYSDIAGAATWVSADKIGFLCRAY